MAEEQRPAGGFSDWLSAMGNALRDGSGSDVPCGDCDACCRSRYFIHIGAAEARTLAAVPRASLAPAPGMPDGTMVMGFDEEGRCPMLGTDGCSIYADRPETCRTYDCRVFAATETDPGPDKPLVGAAARRWVFSYPDATDRAAHDATRAAADYLLDDDCPLPAETRPSNPTQVAMMATAISHLFVDVGTHRSRAGTTAPGVSEVLGALDAHRR